MFSDYLKELSVEAGLTKQASADTRDVVDRLLMAKESSCPGSKTRSGGAGRGLGVGKGKGPVGVPVKAKNKLSEIVKEGQRAMSQSNAPGLLQHMGAIRAKTRANELGIPQEYSPGVQALGATRAGAGALRGGIAGGGLGAALGAGAGLGIGALLKSRRAGAALGGLLGAGGGALAGTGLGAYRAGGRAAEDVRDRLEDRMWDRAVAQRRVANQVRRRALMQRALIGDAVLRRAQQQKTAGFNPFKDPTVVGGLIGAAGGGGIGVLSSDDRSKKGLIRAGMVGATMGAGIGGLAGALSKGVRNTANAQKQMAGLTESAKSQIRHQGFLEGGVAAREALKPRIVEMENMIRNLGGRIA